MKYSARRGTSSARSRSGGTKMGMTLRRKYRSSRKRDARISVGRSLFVAASTRTSTRTLAAPPTGSTTCSCSARSTLACVLRLMSPISSRKSVPPSASSNLPRRSSIAPVNAPLTCPKSSLSISSSGMAAQLTSTNGPPRRRLRRVDRARDELLAGAVLAIDEHPSVGGRGHRHLLAELRHHIALPHHRQAPVHVGAQRAVLRLEPALTHGVADHEDGLLERERLLDEVERAELDRLHRRLDVAVAGDHHDRRIDATLAQARQRCQSVHARQPDVEHDDVVGRAHDAVEARLAALDGVDDIAFVAEHAAQRAAHARFVVDDENSRLHLGLVTSLHATNLHVGSSIVNTVPFGTLSATSMLPPCSAMIRRTIASPSPLPRRLVE